MADQPLNPWLLNSRELPEDRPCGRCDRVLPREAYATRPAKGRFGKPRRATYCRECANEVSGESHRRRRERERAAREEREASGS